MAGLETLATQLLDRPTKLVSPLRLSGASGRASGGISGPAFSGVVGLALMASRPSPWLTEPRALATFGSGYLGRVEQWLKENF